MRRDCRERRVFREKFFITQRRSLRVVEHSLVLLKSCDDLLSFALHRKSRRGLSVSGETSARNYEKSIKERTFIFFVEFYPIVNLLALRTTRIEFSGLESPPRSSPFRVSNLFFARVEIPPDSKRFLLSSGTGRLVRQERKCKSGLGVREGRGEAPSHASPSPRRRNQELLGGMRG